MRFESIGREVKGSLFLGEDPKYRWSSCGEWGDRYCCYFPWRRWSSAGNLPSPWRWKSPSIWCCCWECWSLWSSCFHVRGWPCPTFCGSSPASFLCDSWCVRKNCQANKNACVGFWLLSNHDEPKQARIGDINQELKRIRFSGVHQLTAPTFDSCLFLVTLFSSFLSREFRSRSPRNFRIWNANQNEAMPPYFHDVIVSIPQTIRLRTRRPKCFIYVK